MKKIITILIAVLYMGAATGATVHIHYCMDKLIGWDFQKSDKGKCSNCGMKERKGCCTTHHKMLKLDTDQKSVEASFQWIKILPAMPDYCSGYAYLIPAPVHQKFPLANAPPLPYTIPLFIRYCVFLI